MFKRKEEKYLQKEKYLQVKIFHDRDFDQLKLKINEFLETIGDNVYTIKTVTQPETSLAYGRGLVHVYYWVYK